MHQIAILCVGKDQALLCSRSALLRQAGYWVVEEQHLGRAFGEFCESHYDLVLLCHSMDVVDRNKFSDAIHQRSPAIPVMTVREFAPGPEPHPTIAFSPEPEKLLDGICELFKQSIVSPYQPKENKCHSY